MTQLTTLVPVQVNLPDWLPDAILQASPDGLGLLLTFFILYIVARAAEFFYAVLVVLIKMLREAWKNR